MSIKDRLITIENSKLGIAVSTDTIGAQIASIKVANKKGVKIEVMNQGVLEPNYSICKKTAPNLVITPGPAVKVDKNLQTTLTNFKDEEMSVVSHEVNGETVDAIALKYNNYPTLATQHGWSQYIDYTLRVGGKRNDNYYVLQNGVDSLSPFKYRHYVCGSIEKGGVIRYVSELANISNKPIPGGLG